jgi:hypothetical protein
MIGSNDNVLMTCIKDFVYFQVYLVLMVRLVCQEGRGLMDLTATGESLERL